MKTKFTILILLIFGSFIINSQTLLGEYNFTGATGTDNSGNGNTGIIYGASTTGNELVIGSNTTDYFVIPSTLLNNMQAFSISFKIKFTGFNTVGNYPTNHLFSADNQGLESAVGMSYQKSLNLWRFALNGSLYDFYDNSIVENTWYCVTLTRDANGIIKLYINSVQHANTYTDNSLTYVTSLIVGQETDCTGGCFASDQCSYSMFDNFKIYSGAIGNNSVTSNCNECVVPSSPFNSTPPANLVFCGAATTTLSAVGSGTLQWFGSATSPVILGTGANYITQPLSPGSYTFFVGALTCTQSVSRTPILVTVDPRPQIVVSQASVCSGQTYTLSLSGAYTYTVSGGTAIVTPPATTQYTITGTSLAGCQNTAVATITVNTLPLVTLSGPSVICAGTPNTLIASGATTYSWNTGNIQPAINISPTVTTAYTVTGTDQNNCFNSATVTVTVDKCVSIKDQNINVFKARIFPNPTNNNLNITTHLNCSFEIINELGQIILAGNLSEGDNLLNLTELSQGTYSIKLRTSDNLKTYKFIKLD